jgi:hypothetical protein
MKKRKAQVLLFSVLGIVVILFSISTVLIKTSLTPLMLPNEKFREITTQLHYGSEASVTKGLADASNHLNRKSSGTLYQNYTSLTELNDTENMGLDLLDEWQRETIANNPAAGVVVNYSYPLFECEWYNPINRSGYSSANSNVSIKLVNMGFEQLEEEVKIKFSAAIKELVESDGRETTFKIQFLKERENPITRMASNLITILYESNYRDQQYKSFNETEMGEIRHIGNGTYLVSYQCNIDNITTNLNTIRNNISEIPHGALLSNISVSGPVSNGWHHIAGMRESQNLDLYIDGNLTDREDLTDYNTSISNAIPLYVGKGDVHQSFLGAMDEVRFRKGFVSSGIINADYVNQLNPDSVIVGSQINLSTPWQSAWNHQRNITILSEYFQEQLSDYPFLLRLNTMNFDYSYANASGWDIRFTTPDQVELYYEIEEWNNIGESLIWIRVPTISSSTNTTIYMYYGNPAAGDNQNPSSVWSGSSLIQHLEEDAGQSLDSSINNNDGTYTGSQQDDTGVIDGGDGFDGASEYIQIPHSESLDPGNGDFMVSAWVDIQSNSNRTIISKYNETDGKGYIMYLDEEGNLVFLIDNNDDNQTKNNLLAIVDQVETYYESDERIFAYNKLSELRDKLDPDSNDNVVVEGYDSSEIIFLIDRTLDQLRPHIRIVARDYRGITVSAYGELTGLVDDSYGPNIEDQQATPSECDNDETVTLEATADDTWYGNSSIALVEYFITSNQPNPAQWGTGQEMSPVDGSLDEPVEMVQANFSSNVLSQGENNIWIHAKDVYDNWGQFKFIKVTLIQSNVLHIEDITLEGFYGYFFFMRYNWARATVKIVDGTGAAVENAIVHGVWSGDVSWEGDRATGPDGRCIFDSPYIWGATQSTYTITVNSVQKDGYTWDGISVSETLYYP